VSSPDNVFFVQKNYNDINQYVKNVLMAENCMHKDQDFILVTDISVNEEIVEYYLKKDCKPYLIVLDHHQTAVQLNKFANCCVDESAVKSGADVVLDFIKAMGFKETYLDSLNKYATQWDLFTFKTEEYRKFNIEGKKKAIAEMLNTLYFD
jgi:oligoribonuclease NrnB/cAMP/cGMP phosphodiesterase (DHH superfamily)